MAISKVLLNDAVQMDITDTTATQGQVASTAYYYGADGVKKQGSYVVPSAVTQATPTISVNSSTGLITASATQSAGVVSAGTKSATEQLSTQAAQTLYPSTTDQTISSGKYLPGTQTVKGVLLTNLTAGNIKKDVVVKVGDSADDDRITSVTGTYEGSGGGVTPAEQKDVNFIDYDGTILYSYTKAEIAQLSALPANPSHTGLTAQGWNWTKQEITTQLTAMPDQKVWVGQMYKTTSGKTEIDIELGDAELLTPYLKISVNGTVEVDWGDGSAKDTVTGTSLTTGIYTPHTYATTGNYTISIEVKSGSFTFYNSYILSHTNYTSDASYRYNSSIVAVRFGDGVTYIGDYAFSTCYSLQSVTIPSVVTSIENYAFSTCYSLQSVTIPSGVTSIRTYAFNNCLSLQSVTIPSGFTSIGNNGFRYCYSLQSVTIPSGVTTIGSYVFSYCYSLYFIIFKPTTAPTVSNTTAWTGIPTDCAICIPYSALASYLGKSNYPDKTSYTYIGYATYNSGVTLPTQDSTEAYNVVWYASKADAKAQTNAISQGNGSEIYCRYTAV